MSVKTVNGVELDYVSGSVHTCLKIHNKNEEINEFNNSDYIKLLDYLKSKLKGYFRFSILFNAYQEKRNAIDLNIRNKLGGERIYSDSGGLQVLTKGLDITDEVKMKIYDTQAKYSDFAMSFDEMPLRSKYDQNSKSAGDKGQVYIEELVSIAAQNSAKHIQQQITEFSKLRSKTKILPIIHGFSEESYIEYAENIFNNVVDSENYLAGLSIASLSCHFDTKVGIMKIFDFVPKILNNPKIDAKFLNHVHFLGVARPLRMLPLLLMLKKGLLPIKRLSFDSTAIMRAALFGKAFITLEEIKNPKNFSPTITLNSYKNKNHPNVEQFYQNIHNFMLDYSDYCFETWEDLANHSYNNGDNLKLSEQFKKYGFDYEKKFLAQLRYVTMYNTFAYLSVLEAYIDNEILLSDIIGNNIGILSIFEKFESVNSLEEFNDVCSYFYNIASNGRTDLRLEICKTLKEFEDKYNKKQYCLHEELGIEKDVEILSEELKKPWIKTSIKRARKEDWTQKQHPSNNLF